MDRKPEQRQALDYVRRKGTEAPAADVRQRLAIAFREIEALLEAVPAELTGRRPEPAAWSVHEVVDHLVESHRPAAHQLDQLLAGVSPADPIPAGLLSPEPFHRDWATVTAELRTVHRALCSLLEGVGDDTPAEARAPVAMVVRCATPDGGSEPVHWIESFPWKAFALLVAVHTREHTGQIQRILGRLGD